jgi:hypothetical protein
MGRFNIFLLLSLIAALLVCGRSSKEERKRFHFEKGKAYFQGESDKARAELEKALRLDDTK